MILRVILGLVMAVMSLPVIGQTGLLRGKVKDGEDPIPFANVVVKGTGIGGATDENGSFQIPDVPMGDQKILVSVIGYMPYEQTVNIKEGANDLEAVSMSRSVLGLDEVVVTGTMKETFVSASPIKIDVITNAFLTKTTMPTNLVESVNLVNGVEEVVGCGVCYTNSITINGLPGQYTAILVDGTPLYGNLASVYGLNSIPASMIDRMEVIKGPNSTLYGSEAVAGVINIITKKPKDQPIVDVNFMGTTHAEFFGDIALGSKIGKVYNSTGFSAAYGNRYTDDNKDGFGDFVGMDRYSVFSKFEVDRPENRRASLMAKFYYEDRRNGVEEFMKEREYRTLRGNDSIYGESIYTYRAEVFGTYDLPTKERFWLDYSFSFHDQDSYYGSDSYKAKQYIGFANFIWNKPIKKHDLLVGLTGRYQWYDDNTVATADTINGFAKQQVIPGLFVQDDWNVVKKRFSILGGARLDYYDAHGPIVSPRLSFKYKPGIWTTLRGNFGTGFKVVNLFTEDHAFVTGQREVIIEGKLKPEQSFNGSLNFNHIFTLGASQGSIDVDGFYTHFTNKIIPDYDNPVEIIYRNTSGHARTWGISATINHQFRFPLRTNIGFTYQNATETTINEVGESVVSPILFANDWSGVFSLIYDFKKIGLSIAYSGNVTGPMELPEVFDLASDGTPLPDSRPTRSKPFFIDNLQISKTIKKINLRVFVGIENTMDFRQPISPLTGTNDPDHPAGFSPNFDTSYAYAPIHGREVYAGFRWFLDRK